MVKIEEICPMSPEEIKLKLNQPCIRSCYDCRYHKACLRYSGYAARAYIEQLEEQIQLMKIQMEGDCGVCKHKGNRKKCADCMSIAYHPDWEYEGLPELPKT